MQTWTLDVHERRSQGLTARADAILGRAGYTANAQRRGKAVQMPIGGVVRGGNCLAWAKECLRRFWRRCGRTRGCNRGCKCHRSAKSQQETLSLLSKCSDWRPVRRNGKALGKWRGRFDAVKGRRCRLDRRVRCFACGESAAIRHHIIALGHGGTNAKRNVVALCRKCHAVIHPWLQRK